MPAATPMATSSRPSALKSATARLVGPAGAAHVWSPPNIPAPWPNSTATSDVAWFATAMSTSESPLKLPIATSDGAPLLPLENVDVENVPAPVLRLTCTLFEPRHDVTMSVWPSAFTSAARRLLGWLHVGNVSTDDEPPLPLPK